MTMILGQDGYGPAHKPERGLTDGWLEGYVFSPRHRLPDSQWPLVEQAQIRGLALFDPETYLLRFQPDRLARLPEWPYWRQLHETRARDNPGAYAQVVPAMLQQQFDQGFRTLTVGGPLIPSLYGFESAVTATAMWAAENWRSECGYGGAILARIIHRGLASCA
jgi:hypothetical protein